MEYARAHCGRSVSVLAISMAPGGDVIAAGCSDGSIRVFAAKSLQLVHPPLVAVSPLWNVHRASEQPPAVQTVSWCFAPQSTKTVVEAAQAGSLTEAPSGACGGAGSGAGSGAKAVSDVRAPSVNVERLLVVGCRDGRVFAWARIGDTTRTPVALTIGRHAGWVRRVTSPQTPREDLSFVTGSTDGSVAVWKLDWELIQGAVSSAVCRTKTGVVVIDVDSSDDEDSCVRVMSLPSALPDDSAPKPHTSNGDSSEDDVGTILSTAFCDSAVSFPCGGVVFGAQVSPDGDLIAAALKDGTLRVYVRATHKAVAVVHGHRGPVFDCSWCPNGRYLASCSQDGRALVWQADTLVQREPGVKELHGHDGPVYSVAFSLDGTLLATAGRDHTIRLWDVGSCKRLRTLAALSPCLALSWSHDGARLVCGTESGGLKLWGNLPSVEGDVSGVVFRRLAALEASMVTMRVHNEVVDTLRSRVEELETENRRLKGENTAMAGRVASVERDLVRLVASLQARFGRTDNSSGEESSS